MPTPLIQSSTPKTIMPSRKPKNKPSKPAPEEAQKPEGSPEAEKPKTPPAADVMVHIATQACQLWHDSTSAAFASVGRLTLPVKSKPFRQWLIGNYRHQLAKVPCSDAVGNALAAIEAIGIYEGPRDEAHVRFAPFGDRGYLYLAGEAHNVIEIDSDGWRVCDSPLVRFRHSPSSLPLPMPVHGGSLGPLWTLLGLEDADTRSLLTGWLASCFMPSDGPYPLLVLTGEQGSRKTTLARVLKALTDPSSAPTRTPPKEVKDAMIATRSARVLVYDNLSSIPQWLSDALCVLATGGGMSTRELYSDSDEVIFAAKRPVILTSIADIATRGDLVDRAIVLKLPSIPEERRIPESRFWREFESIHGTVLGALLDRASAGLRALPTTRLDRLPRMADFALWATACERGMGEQARFATAYEHNQSASAALPLDDSPLTAPLLQLMATQSCWSGSPTDLLNELAKMASDPKSHEFPKRANALTNKLRRLLPSLRMVHHLDIDLDGRASDRRRSRLITITSDPDTARETSSVSSSSSKPQDIQAFLQHEVSSSDRSHIVPNGGTSRAQTIPRRSPDDSQPRTKSLFSSLPGDSDDADGVFADTSDWQ